MTMETSRGINRRLHERLAFVDYSSLYSSCLYTCSSHGRRVLPLCFQLSLVFAKKEMKQTKSGFRVSLPPSFSLSLSLSWGFPLQCFKEWPVSSLITRHVIISVVDCEALDPLPPPVFHETISADSQKIRKPISVTPTIKKVNSYPIL